MEALYIGQRRVMLSLRYSVELEFVAHPKKTDAYRPLSSIFILNEERFLDIFFILASFSLQGVFVAFSGTFL